MTQNAVVRARIDEKTKKKAAIVLAAMGLTVSDAFRLMMVRIANDEELPFSPLVPNAETIEAMEAGRRGETTKFDTIAEMMAHLDAKD